MNDRIRELDVFLRVTEETSFSAAARSLDCDPSTVSKLIQRLEDRLQVRLFHRTSRVLKLTREGQQFLESAHRVMDALEEAENGLTQSRAVASGVLRINSPLLIAQHQLSPLVPEFLEKHPGMRVEFILTGTPIDLFENQIDISFQSGNIPDSSMVARRIATTRWTLCAAPRYLAKAGVPRTVEDLRAHNCLNFLAGSFRSTWPMQVRGDAAAIEVKGNIGSNSAELLRSFAGEGMGIARLSELLVGADLASGRLVRVLEAFQHEAEEPLFVVYPSKRNLSLRVRAFLDFLNDKFKAGWTGL
ncbi:LysR family transcriptional regulator [Variovorax sp. WS11]|uniref:LysR family transcriptional regulator n=1 Tax=Variovorax sp. WS11 TaxID=1105204 RepID=UPI0013DBA6EE|nr:LysR family transcriptional regulator [Variovorax sp. WS11]NDZ18552.1 LysR family transcriptional regulator [Variovorax sp. WS11]